MKGFETNVVHVGLLSLTSSKKECPAMKGFETRFRASLAKKQQDGKKECPAMKGFETLMRTPKSIEVKLVRRNAPL